MLKLTADEQAWLENYRTALDKKHRGAVREMLIYGSKREVKLTRKAISTCS